MRIWIENGQLLGKIEKLFLKPGEDPNPKCEECPGDKKGQPLEGMTILWGLTQDGEVWTGGYILDPDNGKIYKCKVRVEEGGKTLAVRGFIGFSLLGRTQTWIRVE